jgi:hypothetical protein
VLGSLLVTFIALSATFLRALHLMHRLAECSEAESKCLYNAQRFVYKRFLRHFVKVDVELLELQATGACQSFVNGGGGYLRDATEDELGSTNVITAEVRILSLINLVNFAS